MKNSFEQFVPPLNISPLSIDILHQITELLQEQTTESFSVFISQSFQSLLNLERWMWQLLSQKSDKWINELSYQKFFYTVASFNKKLIFHYDSIEVDDKATLLFCVTVDQINDIFKQIDNSDNDNDPFITIISLWFDNHSYFLQDNPLTNASSIIDHINQYMIQNYITSERYKSYLTQLSQPNLSHSIFTAKMLFYIKTCSFSVFSYISIRAQKFPCAPDDLLGVIRDQYLQIIRVHSRRVVLWSKELLACIAQLIGFTAGICWWDGQKRTQIKLLFPDEQTLCDHIQDLIRIMDYRPFHEQIQAARSNDETSLLDSVVLVLIVIVRTQNISWFFRSNTTIQNALVTLAEISPYDGICLCVYGILGEVLTQEQLKYLKIVNTMSGFFFNMLEQAWHHPLKRYKQIPIEYLLRGFFNLSKHDFIQQRTFDSNKMPLLIEICDVYPIVYDIIWALSFNQDIQQQLRSSSSFMSKLAHLNKTCDNEQMRKITHGILWNLEINHEDRPPLENTDQNSFDIMISYSHKDKVLCKQLYEELIKGGYRVWIDFDQMHGNVMDAMAQAIDRSQIIIICMSEQYRKSNYCRAEAHYAFQRQRKIVPVLMQKHYKPDGWLLFLVGQLLYVDFNKYEFAPAMEMLMKELPGTNNVAIKESCIHPKQNTNVMSVAPSMVIKNSSVPSNRPQNILKWTSTHVQDWLIEHNLVQMSRLLNNCDGRSLLYLNKHIKRGEREQTMKSLHEDSIRQIGENLSLIELSRLQSLIDQEKRFARTISPTQSTKINDNKDS